MKKRKKIFQMKFSHGTSRVERQGDETDCDGTERNRNQTSSFQCVCGFIAGDSFPVDVTQFETEKCAIGRAVKFRREGARRRRWDQNSETCS